MCFMIRGNFLTPEQRRIIASRLGPAQTRGTEAAASSTENGEVL